FIPRLCVQPACNAELSIERKIVLHGSKNRQACFAHRQALPVFLEPASIISMDIESNNAQTSNRGGLNVHDNNLSSYLKSVAKTTGPVPHRQIPLFLWYLSTTVSYPGTKRWYLKALRVDRYSAVSNLIPCAIWKRPWRSADHGRAGQRRVHTAQGFP